MEWTVSLQLSIILVLGCSWADAGRRSVLLVSLGGVRSDSLVKLSNLSRFAKEGTRAVHVKSVFPTERLPTAVSLSTGVYPEVHGVVANRKVEGKKVFESDRAEARGLSWNSDAEPLWVTARRHGVESAVLGFPGADVDGMKAGEFVNQSCLWKRAQRLRWTFCLESRLASSLGWWCCRLTCQVGSSATLRD